MIHFAKSPACSAHVLAREHTPFDTLGMSQDVVYSLVIVLRTPRPVPAFGGRPRFHPGGDCLALELNSATRR